jgi:hypothetical protein
MVFTLGLPTYLYQVVVPDELKRFVRRHTSMPRLLFWCGFLYLVLALTFLWYPTLFGEGDEEAFGVAQIAMSGCVFLSIVFWLFANRKLVFAAIVARLERRICRGIRRSGTIPFDLLADLTALGREAESGGRTAVLSAVERIVVLDQRRVGYAGNGLQETLKGMEEMLSVPQGIARIEENLVVAARILQDVVSRAKSLGQGASPDAALAVRVAGRLGARSLEKGLERPITALVEVASSDPQELSRLGARALALQSYRASIACLNRLEAIVLKAGTPIGKPVWSLLGLLAHFWGHGGASRLRAQEAITRLAAQNVTASRIEEARSFYLRLGEFETADGLNGLAKAWAKHALNGSQPL